MPHPSLRVRLVSALAASVALLSAASDSDAVPITFQFTGTVFNDTGLAGAGIPIESGDPVSGYFTFESATPDADPTVGTGSYTSGLIDFQVTMGGYSAALGASNQFTIQDTDPYELYAITTDPAASQGHDAIELGLALLNILGPTTGLDDEDLPLTPPDLADFASKTVGLVFVSGSVLAIANIETLTLPEPGTLALLGSGLLGTASVARRRRAV